MSFSREANLYIYFLNKYAEKIPNSSAKGLNHKKRSKKNNICNPTIMKTWKSFSLVEKLYIVRKVSQQKRGVKVAHQEKSSTIKKLGEMFFIERKVFTICLYILLF